MANDELTTPAWRRLRLLILERDRFECQIRARGCNRAATCVDHIVARADGGDMWNPDNLRAACRPCNGSRSADRTNAARGWGYRTGVAEYVSRF